MPKNSIDQIKQIHNIHIAIEELGKEISEINEVIEKIKKTISLDREINEMKLQRLEDKIPIKDYSGYDEDTIDDN